MHTRKVGVLRLHVPCLPFNKFDNTVQGPRSVTVRTRHVVQKGPIGMKPNKMNKWGTKNKQINY